jgi:hypothetical protein
MSFLFGNSTLLNETVIANPSPLYQGLPFIRLLCTFRRTYEDKDPCADSAIHLNQKRAGIIVTAKL